MSLKMTIRLCSVMAVVIVMLMEIEMGSAIDMGQYQGCYETSNNQRPLVDPFNGGETSSVDDCARTCRESGSSFAGIQAGTKCRCGNVINSLAQASFNCYTDTAMRCSGDSNTICGGVDAMSIYRVCPPDKKGTNCELDCSTDCGNKGCSIGGSGCLGSCDAGFYSNDTSLNDNCPNECAPGKYGLYCGYNCPDGCNNGECAPRDGRCTAGCKDNTKRGPHCTDTCVPGKWGSTCEQACPSDCPFTCNSVSGLCDQCSVGLYGHDCNTSCPTGCAGECGKTTGNCVLCYAGKYGDKCDEDCSKGCWNGQCEKDSGSCSCISGWTGTRCESCLPNCVACDSSGCTSCKTGYHGSTCQSTCGGGCVEGRCDKGSGQCLCINGWMGVGCDQCLSNCAACDTSGCTSCWGGFYGAACQSPCSVGCVNRQCYKELGECTCISGWAGTGCDQCLSNCASCDSSGCTSCDNGFYGATCQSSCSVGCVSRQCNKAWGSCSCINGWTGTNCDQCLSNCETCDSSGCTSCKTGFYGAKCESSCSDGCVNKQCNKGSGECSTCISGWKGSKCDQCLSNCAECNSLGCTSCVNNDYYGNICQTRCSSNCLNRKCRKSDGTCSGCNSNRYGRMCNGGCPSARCATCQQWNPPCTSCKVGRWGSNTNIRYSCNQRCSTGCEGGTCNRNTGVCMCKPGWYGASCQIPCGDQCNMCSQQSGCTRCNSGYHGITCESSCADGCQEGTCDKGTGNCVCKMGYYLARCTSSCATNCEGGCEKDSGRCNQCMERYYGQTCSDECKQNCLAGCNQDSAKCNGCVDGKHGELCDADCALSCDAPRCEQDNGECPCAVGFYGLACDKVCSKKCLEKTCDKTDGKCTIGCVNNYWSPNCTEICPENCKDNTCDRTSGECSLGCDNTYWSSYCNQTCPENCKDGTCNQATSHCSDAGCKDDFYGDICNLTCSPTCATRECDRESGECLRCKDGFYGGYCTQTCTGNCLGNRCRQYADATICSSGCKDGFHGVSCEETCPDNCLDNKCKQTGGICQQCIPGKQGDQCDANCDSLAFGPGCNGTCHCADDVSCDPESGACPGRMCAPGYEGSSCQGVVATGVPGFVTPLVISIIAVAVIVVVIVFVVVRRYRRARVSKPPNTLDDNPGEDAIPLHVVNNNGYTDMGNTAGDVEASLDAGKATATKPPVKKKPTVPVKPRLNNDYSSVPLTLDQVAPHIKASEHNNALTLEFESLPMKQQAAWDVAMEQPKERNRFKNIMPYDDNRVKLQVPEGSDITDYINASYIPGIFNTKDEYIASQGPTTHILADFIRMIWELKINTIVMVTSLEEKGTVKCTRYWPEGVGKSRTHRGINVTLMEEVIKMGRAERTMVFNQGSDNLTVTQLHYTSWPDHGVPPSATVLLDIRRTLREMHHTSPILVHCSAGVGRTGTFIALDMLLSGAEINGTVNVPAMVKTLRASRVNMVQTQNQYDFLYKAVYEGLHMGPTLFTLNELKDFMAEDDFGDDLAKQFNILEEFRPVIAPQNLLAAHLPANVDKNRFPEILPASRDRVILMTKVDERTDYINAVNVNGPNQQSQFVATQVPLTDTIVDMWRMVMDYKISVVVYLKNPNNKVQKTPRWIPTSSSPLRLPCCNVHLEKKDEGGDVRHVVVTAGQGPSQEDQEPGLYGNVNARGRPLMDMDPGAAGAEESEYMNVGAAANAAAPPTRYEVAVLTVSMDSPGTLIDAVKRMNDMEPDPTKSRAIVCWNGVAECGVFIATHWLLDMADKYEEVDIYDTVFRIRAHRPFFIENVEQYKFLYEIAEEIANRKTL